VDQWVNSLNDLDREELRRLQLQHAAVSRQNDKEPDWASLSDSELEVQKRRLGFYNR
jgi:hypothetical protein